jgi:hypothetical protein
MEFRLSAGRLPFTGLVDLSQVFFAVNWLVLLLHIRESPGSNLCQKTGYPEQDFVLLL